jgi:thymidylate kinase
MTKVFAFEGGDACGKTLVTQYVADQLNANGIKAVRVPIIEASMVGKLYKDTFTHGGVTGVAQAAGMLYSVVATIDQVVAKHVQDGKIVILDRSLASFGVYQLKAHGYHWARSIYEKTIDNVFGNPYIDYKTIFLDTSGKVAMDRINHRGNADLIESRGAGFHEQVRTYYKEIFKEYPQLAPAHTILTDDKSRDGVCELAFDFVNNKI